MENLKSYIQDSLVTVRGLGQPYIHINYDQLDDHLKSLLVDNVNQSGPYPFPFIILRCSINDTKHVEFTDEFVIFDMGFKGKPTEVFLPYTSFLAIMTPELNIQTLFNCNIELGMLEKMNGVQKEENKVDNKENKPPIKRGKPNLTIVK